MINVIEVSRTRDDVLSMVHGFLTVKSQFMKSHADEEWNSITGKMGTDYRLEWYQCGETLQTIARTPHLSGTLVHSPRVSMGDVLFETTSDIPSNEAHILSGDGSLLAVLRCV